MSAICSTRHDHMVELLRAIWGGVLHKTRINDQDNFFDLGGDSLAAISLFLEIKRAVGLELPITTIYDAPTVGALAQLLSHDAAPHQSTVVQISRGSAWPPIFVAHGIGGGVMDLSALGPHLGAEHPVYALQARGLDGSEPPHDRVEDMALAYLPAIKTVQPEGPYVLLGWSFGGLIALELARSLTTGGDQVAMLALADTFPHPRFWPLASWLPSMLGLLWFHARGLATRRPTGMLAHVVPRACKFLSYIHPHPALFRLWDAEKFRALPQPLGRVRQAGYTAWTRYKLPAYDGTITYFAAERLAPGWPADPAKVWRPHTPNMKVQRVLGGHSDMLTVHAKTFAASFLACLRNSLHEK